MTKAYISGVITGDDNYKAKFRKAEQALLKVYDEVYNPAEFQLGDSFVAEEDEWIEYIIYDMERIWYEDFTHFVKLPDHAESIGGQIELIVANKKGLEIVEYINYPSMKNKKEVDND